MWHDRDDKSKTTGVESDAYWMGIFLGIILSFAVTFILAFFVLPGDILIRVYPLLFLVAIVVSYFVARFLTQYFSGLVRRRRATRSGKR